MIAESDEVRAMREQQEAAERDAAARGPMVAVAYALGAFLVFVAAVVCAVLVLL